jgi:hypothetical protein
MEFEVTWASCDAGFAVDCSREMAEPIASWQIGHIGRDGLEWLPSAELPARDVGGHLGQPVCADGVAGILPLALGRETVLAGNALHLLAAHCGALFAAKAVDDLTASLPEATIAICGLDLLFRFEVGLLACGAAAIQPQWPRLETPGASQAALTLNAGSSVLGRKITSNLSGFPVACGARWVFLASAPSAFKAFACAFSAAISAACEAMSFSSRVLACRLCFASFSSISATFLSLDALMAAHLSDARLRSRARMSSRVGFLPSAMHGASFVSASRQCAQARPVRL